MRDDTIDLWAMDEVHFQQHGSRCRLWVPPEAKDPILLQHPTRRSVGYFGAVRLRNGAFVVRRELDRFKIVINETVVVSRKRLGVVNLAGAQAHIGGVCLPGVVRFHGLGHVPTCHAEERSGEASTPGLVDPSRSLS
ncbi:MAG: hypothetical protein HYY02_04695 [Chloroflexi bacterium]|nr:hypothetical protein [Chloroflexota bacterium]